MTKGSRVCFSGPQTCGRLKWMLLLLLVLCFNPQPAYSQGLPGRLTGTVVDPTAAVVPGANVTLTNEATNAVLRTISGSQGFFVFAAVPAATYTLTIEKEGFAKWQRTGIEFHPGDAINIPDIVLKVGEVARDVTVTASPEVVLPVDSGEKSSVITAHQIQNLSILGRDATELLKILPGVVYTGEGTQGEVQMFSGGGIGNSSVAGTRTDSLDIVSDGATVIDPFCNCGSAVTPNVDMVQEFKVQMANFSAENTKGPAVIQTITKGGTSEYHGSAYIHARHNRFNSQDWINNRFGIPKPQDSFYYPGFNIGGPIPKTRNKLFFFFGSEWMRQNVALDPIAVTVPTAAMRQGDFTDAAYIQALNGFDVNTMPLNDAESGGGPNWAGPPLDGSMLSGGVINPNSFDPGGKILLNLYPLPNLDPAQNNGFNFISSIVNPQHRNQQRARVDYNISDKTKFYTVFNHEGEQDVSNYHLWWTFPDTAPYPSRIIGKNRSWSTSNSLVNIFSPTATNEVVFSTTVLNNPAGYENRSAIDRAALGYPYQGVFKQQEGLPVPGTTSWEGGVANLLQPGGFDPELYRNMTTVTAGDNFTKVYKTHTMKFGAYFQYTTNDGASFNADQGWIGVSSWGGNSTGNAWADLLMGRITQYQEWTANPVAAKRWREFSFYVQDSWKATPRLTLELGARFQHLGFMYETHGWLAGFDPSKYDPNAPVSDYTGIVAQYRGDDVTRSIFRTPALRVSPRIGFAYDLTGSGNTVIRGGGGVFRYRDAGVLQEVNHANPPLQQSVDICCGYLLSDIDRIEPGSFLARPNELQLLDPSDNNVPTTYSWSLTLSKRIPSQTVLEASYVGTTGRNQLNTQDINYNAVPEGAMFPYLDDPDFLEDPPSFAQSFRPFPTYGTLALRRHILTQNYHAFQLTAQRWTGRINYSAAYTFSKALGTLGLTQQFGGLDSFDLRGRLYGVLPYDRTHSLRIAYNVLLPDATRNRILRQALNGWQVSGITSFESGSPFQIVSENFAGTINMIGTSVDGDELSGENAAMFIAGTPDTTVQAALSCDPRDGLGKDQWANPNCFAAPSRGNNGTYQLPYLKRPYRQNHDLSIFKNFKWGSKESQTLQFRFSMYNFVNHPTWVFEQGDPGLVLNFDQGVLQQDSIEEFGRPIKKRGKRMMQFGLKFSF
jgi:hypothetical protein